MNDRSRPAKAAPEVIAATDSTLRATTDFLAHLAACSGLDDPAFRAASLLADAWGPALARSYRLGNDIGYDAGRRDAEREMADAWHRVWVQVRGVLAQPTHDELTARRARR